MTIENRLTCLERNIDHTRVEMERADAVYTIQEMKDMGEEIERLQEIYVGIAGKRYDREKRNWAKVRSLTTQ